MSEPAPASFRDIYTVSRLTAEARMLLEGHYPAIWIEGEISNLARPGSGHLYFSLKDAGAQVRCAMFKPRSQRLGFRPENGVSVLARARASVFEARGDFQLIIEHLEPAGEGALRAAFEALKARLAAEGLFEPERKRPLPALPRAIGVVTSPTGAAIRDVLSVLARRWPALPVVLYPCLVQGAQAAPTIVRAIEAAGRRNDVDVLLVVRGGGSLEDLWPFNEETVARAIAACPIPVVSGVGHETDVSIADWAADLRAATPSAAAELACPDASALARAVRQSGLRLTRSLRASMSTLRTRLLLAHGRLLHPARRLEQLSQRLDEAGLRGRHALTLLVQRRRLRLERAAGRLANHAPGRRLVQLRHDVLAKVQRSQLAMGWLLKEQRERWKRLSSSLLQASPQSTLARGYAIVREPLGKALVRTAAQALSSSTLNIEFADGSIEVDVKPRNRS